MECLKIILLLIVSLVTCNILNMQYDDDNPTNRIARAAPVTVKPVKTPVGTPVKTPGKPPVKTVTAAPVHNQKHSTIPELVKHHMMIGRIFNALYLQVQLANNQIDYYDVIAGVWNLKDKSIVEKLSSLKVDGLSESLAKLDANIKADNSGATMTVGVEAMEEKMKSVRAITEEQKRDLIESMNSGTLPKYLQPGKNKKDLDGLMLLRNLEDNPASRAAEALKSFESLQGSRAVIQAIQNWGTAVLQCADALSTLPSKIKEVLADKGSIEALEKGITVAESLKTKEDDFTALHDIFGATEEVLGKIQQLGDGASLDNVKSKIDTIESILQGSGQKSNGLPIGPAFSGNVSMVLIDAAFDDMSVKKVLNKGSTLSKLWVSLPDFKKFSNDFEPVSINSKNIFGLETAHRLFRVANVIDEIQKVVSLAEKSSLNDFSSCLKVTDKIDDDLLKRVADLSTTLPSFKKGLEDLNVIYESQKNLNDVVKNLDAAAVMFDKFKTKPIEDFENYMNTTEGAKVIGNMNKLVTDLSKNLFPKLQPSADFLETANKVFQAAKEIGNVQAWLGKFKIAKPECDALSKFKPESLKDLGSATQLISLVKSRSDIGNLQPLLNSIPKVSAGLRNLKNPEKQTPSVTEKPPIKPGVSQKPPVKQGVTQKPNAQQPPKKSKRSTDSEEVEEFKPKDPQNLLDASFSMRSLEIMEEIHQHDKMIEIVVKRGAEAKQKVESDSGLSVKFGNVWKGFDELKNSLTVLQTGIKNALAKIPLAGEGNTFAEVQQVYSSISTVPITSKPIQLREYRQSIMEFSDPASWQDLEDALAKLEKPLQNDFKMSYASFSRMPQALKTLENDLEQFFLGSTKSGSDGGSEGGGKTLLIIAIVGGVVLLLCIGGSCWGFFYWWTRVRDPEMKKELPEDESYWPSEDAWDEDYTYMQHQDSRDKLNKRDENGNTPLYKAVLEKRWRDVEDMVSQGAILDAVCAGTEYRTVLHEVLQMRERAMVQGFMEHGASTQIHDKLGDEQEMYMYAFGFWGILHKYLEIRKETLRTRTIADTPRPWNILVFDAKCFPRKLRKKLPLRIKKNTTWGYKDGLELNDFTMIVVPPKYVKDEHTLSLLDNDFMTWKLYGCAATLITKDWLHALVNEPGKTKELMSEDYKFWLLNTHYNDKTHKNTIHLQKTLIHRLQPPLFSDIKFFFLETKDKKALAQQKEWIEIIKMFGGTCPDKITQHPKDHPGPYHTLSIAYAHNNFQEYDHSDISVNSWLLTYPDTKVKNEHRYESAGYQVAAFAILPESIARCYILGFENKIVPLLDTIPDPDGTVEESSQANGDSNDKTNTSTLKSDGKTPVSTGGANAAATTTTTKSISTTTNSTVGAAATQSKMQQAERVRNKLMGPKRHVRGPNGRMILSKEAVLPTSVASKEPSKAATLNNGKRRSREVKSAEKLPAQIAPQ